MQNNQKQLVQERARETSSVANDSPSVTTYRRSHSNHRTETVSIASPRVIIYRTYKDYNNNVPVIMDETKTRIVSFPAPSDVRGIPTPTILAEGYLLDNRGIGKNAVFTSYTYEEYAALDATPSQEELMARIIDKEPFAEIWLCDRRHTYKNLIKDLNKLIKSGFVGCTKL